VLFASWGLCDRHHWAGTQRSIPFVLTASSECQTPSIRYRRG
jgi:hypothetical protein